MKKLIALAAVATCGAALAVESANIVGYQQKDLPSGFCNGVATFVNVAQETMSITDMIPRDSEGNTLGGGVFQLQTTKPSGGADEQFLYLFEDDVGEELGDGWYNGDGETLATKVFEVGEGFVFNSSVEGAKLTFAGQVVTKAVDVGIATGFSDLGNMRPSQVSIQSIVPVDADGATVGGGAFQLQTIKPSGGADEQFLYLFEDDVGEELGDGWYNGDGETLATKVFEPGEGFVFNSSVVGGKLKFAALGL